MKGIIKQGSRHYNSEKSITLAPELLILGIVSGGYYLLNESNCIVLVPKEDVEITDHEKPDFWIEDNGRLVPEEWFFENYFIMNSDLYDEWDEIWNVTQFAKGILKFNLPEMPLNYAKGIDTEYKIDLISNHLKLAAEYDSLVDGDLDWRYTFRTAPNEGNYYEWLNGEAHYFKRELMSDKTSGFDILEELLTQIGYPFGKTNNYRLERIRNRILFSIWSLFGTKEFAVYKLVYDKNPRDDYAITWEDKTYLLSFDYSI